MSAVGRRDFIVAVLSLVAAFLWEGSDFFQRKRWIRKKKKCFNLV